MTDPGPSPLPDWSTAVLICLCVSLLVLGIVGVVIATIHYRGH